MYHSIFIFTAHITSGDLPSCGECKPSENKTMKTACLQLDSNREFPFTGLRPTLTGEMLSLW